MCGISGYFSLENQTEQLDLSLNSISHRGPDSSGKKTWALDDKLFIGLGHVRLSILDLSVAGNQPMLSSDGGLAMIFNGEIYNFIELRKHLQDHVFIGVLSPLWGCGSSRSSRHVCCCFL